MKLLHISDLHIGRRVNEFSMLEDQRYILNEILRIAKEQKVDGILAAGDIYDKSVPPAEAVQLLDDFFTRTARAGILLYVISGNHDSAERVAFGAGLFDQGGIYISPVYHGKIEPVRQKDAYGYVNIYLIPFLKPAAVHRFFPEKKTETYQEAFAAVLEELQPDCTQRNVVVAHQFFTGAVRSESEDLSLGGLDNIDAGLLEQFDYAALGHIHRPQKLGRETIRYCGTPLKYSFSEAGDTKSVTVVELKEKGNVTVETIPLKPLRELREIRGTYEEVTLKENYEQTNVTDYMHITLTDEEDIPGAAAKLRAIYPNLMKLDYDNRRTRENRMITGAAAVQTKTPLELFEELYRLQNNQEMTEEQKQYVQRLVEEVWETV
ncbi:exonuclease SbcCD subunit D [Marvinbryantia formatexigens]|nr:exonuclease SbcCD subunit D [Marvinbryantia formatexigens]UWO26547.1 exonuclease SbcCD subunit D [Marvinbryantia formatexigens DSM 14469]SDF76523.1 Exodeoxyribonuclease I subunit D [Marvinbryantia formatexigens]